MSVGTSRVLSLRKIKKSLVYGVSFCWAENSGSRCILHKTMPQTCEKLKSKKGISPRRRCIAHGKRGVVFACFAE